MFDGPFVVLLSQDGANQATHGWPVSEDAHHIGAAFGEPTSANQGKNCRQLASDAALSYRTARRSVIIPSSSSSIRTPHQPCSQ